MDFFGKEKNFPSEYDSHEINRTTRGKSFQTLENIKRNNSKVDTVPIDNIREFLQETNNSFCSDDGRIPKDNQKLEKKIFKQQYLVNNNIFDPTDYFGGLEVSNLGDQVSDQRLDDMLFYLPTEMEENEEVQAQKPMEAFNSVPKTQTLTNSQPKAESTLKNVNNSNTLSFTKVAPNKAISAQFFDVNKQKKSPMNQITSILNNQPKSKLNSDVIKSSTLNDKTREIPSPSVKMFQGINSLNSSQDLKQSITFSKKKFLKDLNNKENKNDKNEITQFDENSFSSQKKNNRFKEGKSFSKTSSELTSNFSSQKSVGSLHVKNKPTMQGSFHQHHASLINPIKSLNLVPSNKSEQQNKLLSENSSSKILNYKATPTTPFQVKLEKSRAITKSIDRNKESKSSERRRKIQKNFSSFTGTLSTEEETELMFKSYCNTNTNANTILRPKTVATPCSEDNNYVLKGILSPKLNKSLVTKQNTINNNTRCEKDQEKHQSSNSLKFLNDLLNKRKISCSSSDHLRMPKKPSFLGKKLESPTAQLIQQKQLKTLTKSDTFEARVSSQIVKKAQPLPKNYYPSPCSSKKFKI